jgi:hypothetical protein
MVHRAALLALCLVALPGAFASAAELPEAVTGTFLRSALLNAACEADYADARDSAMVHEMSANHRLVDIPCRYEDDRNPNHRSLMFLVDLRGPEPETVALAPPDGKSAGLVANAEVDERRKLVLSATFRSAKRDCGTIGRWRFNGTAFELRDFFVKTACDGEPFDVSNRAVEKWRVFPEKKRR